MINVIAGIVVGLILGLIGAVGFTMWGLASSNVVGKGEGSASDFMSEDNEVVFHEQRDEKVIIGIGGAKRVDVNTYRGGKYR